jgi:hypothetical protein
VINLPQKTEEITITLKISKYRLDSLNHYSEIINKSLGEIVSEIIEPTPINWNSEE